MKGLSQWQTKTQIKQKPSGQKLYVSNAKRRRTKEPSVKPIVTPILHKQEKQHQASTIQTKKSVNKTKPQREVDQTKPQREENEVEPQKEVNNEQTKGETSLDNMEKDGQSQREVLPSDTRGESE